jgi:hypothetical protein
MRGFGLIALAAVITGLVVGVVIADSGGSGKATPSVPELTPPPGTISGTSGTTDQGTTSTNTTTNTTSAPSQTSTQTTPSQTSGGAGAPQSDTPQNNQPPPKGSPAGRFEQFCKDNPGAC